MKQRAKIFIVVVAIFICCVLVLSNVAYTTSAKVDGCSQIKVSVVDLDGNAIHNATVKVLGTDLAFNTDNNGITPLIDLPTLTNNYDKNIKQWYTVNLQVKRKNYVDTFLLNCVVYTQQVRKVTIKIYQQDGSNLPYVCYVESPPNDYLISLTS